MAKNLSVCIEKNIFCVDIKTSWMITLTSFQVKMLKPLLQYGIVHVTVVIHDGPAGYLLIQKHT